MDMGKIDNGYLVAKSFKTGAESAAKFIEENHNKKIDLILRDELPINLPPTEDELKKYY
ncbi:hypothetical protein AAHB51_18115 [Bacillus cereus]